MNHKYLLVSTLLTSSILFGCSDDNESSDETSTPSNIVVPDTYSFTSKFSTESSVSYSGQIARHALISALNDTIGNGLSDMIQSGQLDSSTTREDVIAILNSYYEDGTDSVGDQSHGISTTPATSQTTFNDISTGKNLVGKIAGNDDATDHKDWDGGDFIGWGDIASPDALIQEWFGLIADNVLVELSGTNRVDPVTQAPLAIYQTTSGRDLKQLTQKFLLSAITFSQGADDYLDDGTEGKGILSDNTAAASNGASPYTALEHQWDEGYGYFGAARDYAAYTDDEIAQKGGRDEYQGYYDSNADGMIDLNSEFNFGFSQNAAKRDRGATTGVDMTAAIFTALKTGRAIITEAEGALTDEEFADLQTQRDIVVLNWEKAIVATVVHYINDTLADMDAFGTDAYSLADHSKHWSEMKGFAFAMQFNPRSPLSSEQFATLHDYFGTSPVLSNAEQTAIDAYEADLLAARSLIQSAYAFDVSDVENW